MSHISLRVSGVVKEKYTMLSEGTYDFEISNVELGTSRSGNPQLIVRASVIDGPSGIGRSSTLWLSMVETAAWRIAQLLDGCSVKYRENEISDGIRDLDFDPEDLIGKRFRCDVSYRAYEGKSMEDYKSFRSVDSEESFLPPDNTAQKTSAPNQGNTPTLARRRRPNDT